MGRQDVRTGQASAHIQRGVRGGGFGDNNHREHNPRRNVIRTIERLGISMIAVIEHAMVVVVGVDVVSDASLGPMNVNRRAAVGGMQMRRR